MFHRILDSKGPLGSHFLVQWQTSFEALSIVVLGFTREGHELFFFPLLLLTSYP